MKASEQILSATENLFPVLRKHFPSFSDLTSAKLPDINGLIGSL